MLDAVWNRLKERCCFNPEKAKRCVMVSKEDLKFALGGESAEAAIRADERAAIISGLRRLVAELESATPDGCMFVPDGIEVAITHIEHTES